MSSICGIFNRSGQAIRPGAIAAMTAAMDHWHGDRTGTWSNPSGVVALGHVLLINTPESRDETLPFHDPVSRLAITADARIDNREDLYREMDIPILERTTIPDSGLILMAYQKWGRKCAAHLIGDFAFAVWDEREKRLFCARDHLGNKPLFYFASGDAFIFATEMKSIFKVTGVPQSLNEDWIADALTVLVSDKEYTPYADIRRLPPAHWFSISPAEINKDTYWRLDPEKEIWLSTEDDYVEAFGEKLTEAVRCRVRSVFPIGSELSGGLDSSMVTALAARQVETQDSKLMAFSNVMGEADRTGEGSLTGERKYQELLRRYARINQAFNLAAQDRGVIETLRNSLYVQDGPSHRVYGNFTDALHEAAAREGARTLLSGFGGDEVVSHPAGEYLKELAQRKAWQAFRQENRRRPTAEQMTVTAILFKMAGEYLPLLKTAGRRIRDKCRETGRNLPSRHLESFPLNPEFYHSAAVGQRLATIPRMPSGQDVRSSQCLRLMHSHVPARLEHGSIEAAANRIEYRYPLLDIRLLEFHLAVPSGLKRKNGYGRYLFRRSGEGVFPPEIQWRDDKTGAAIPAVRQRCLRDAAAIAALIQRAVKTEAARYINLEQMRKRLERIVQGGTDQIPVRQGIFLNALKLLLYFDQDR